MAATAGLSSTLMSAKAELSSASFMNTFPRVIREVVTQFQQQKGVWICKTTQYLKIGDCSYYGIHRVAQTIWDKVKCAKEIKTQLLSKMGMHPETPIYQIVGDSGAFSLEGTKNAMNFFTRTHSFPHSYPLWMQKMMERAV